MYLPHQQEKARSCAEILHKSGVCLLYGAPRSGKTRTAILTAALLGYKKVLVITKKRAISGWQSELEAVGVDIPVTNYEQAPKIDGRFDLVILDESHALAKVGKPNQRIRQVKRIAWESRILCLSGTPVTETPLGIFYQFGVSRWTPFGFKSFYDFWRCYGIPDPIWVRGRQVEQYKKHKPKLLDDIKKFVVTMSQEDAGISREVQATDKVHDIDLDGPTRDLIRQALRDGVIEVHGREVVLDSEMAVRVAVHQIEAGALKLPDGEIFLLDNTEIVEYLLREFRDTADLALMCHFHSTRMKLERYFSKAAIFSSNAHAEGVDLSGFDHFVIVNGDYSGAKFLQRRERVVNIKKRTRSVVHHIVSSHGVSRRVYDVVSDKKSFSNHAFKRFRNERADTTTQDTEVPEWARALCD